MKQDITLSYDLFCYLDEYGGNPNLRGSDPDKILNHLTDENKLLIDKESFWSEVDLIIENSKIKTELGIVKSCIPNNKFESFSINDTTITKNQVSDKDIRTLGEIAATHGDRILIKYNCNLIHKHILKEKLSVNCYNFDEYLNPPSDCNLLRPFRRQFVGGELFDVSSFFEPYIKNTNTLKIQDPFSPKPTFSNRMVLEKILRLCKPNTKVVLETLPFSVRDKDYNTSMENKKIIDNGETSDNSLPEEELKNVLELDARSGQKDSSNVSRNALYKIVQPILPKHIHLTIKERPPTIIKRSARNKYTKKQIHARFIITDDWFIDIDQGLDFWVYDDDIRELIVRNEDGVIITTKR